MQLTLVFLKARLQHKKGKMWEFSPSRGPPLHPFWEPYVCEENKLWFILHFRTLKTFSFSQKSLLSEW